LLSTQRYVGSRYLLSFPTRRSSDLLSIIGEFFSAIAALEPAAPKEFFSEPLRGSGIFKSKPSPASCLLFFAEGGGVAAGPLSALDRKSTRLNSSHVKISYAVFCLKK